jgi:hypothetical protein
MTDQRPRRKFGPTKGELQFWLVVSIAGFAFLGVALSIRGWPSGPGWFEFVGIPSAFFGWLLVRSFIRLRKGDYPPG